MNTDPMTERLAEIQAEQERTLQEVAAAAALQATFATLPYSGPILLSSSRRPSNSFQVDVHGQRFDVTVTAVEPEPEAV